LGEKKKNEVKGLILLDFRTYYKSSPVRNALLVSRQTNQPMEQNTESRKTNKPMEQNTESRNRGVHIWSIDLQQRWFLEAW
jgi:hypothetical protein